MRIPSLPAALLLLAIPNDVHVQAAADRSEERSRPAPAEPDHLQGEMAGAVTRDSVILQSRLTAARLDEEGDVPGADGVARFEIATDGEFTDSRYTPWLEARAEDDYLIKTKVTGLKPGTIYYYRAVFGRNREEARPGTVRRFRTLHGPDKVRSLRPGSSGADCMRREHYATRPRNTTE